MSKLSAHSLHIQNYTKSEYDQEYHNHTLKTNVRHREEEPQNTNSPKTSGRQFKQSNQHSPPCQYDCKTRNDTK